MTIRAWLLSPVLAVLADINRKVDDMTRENETRNELAEAIGGAIEAFDAERGRSEGYRAQHEGLVAERDALRTALQTADADKAAAIEAATVANDEGDAQWNADQVERLRLLQPAVDNSPTGQLAPPVPPGSGLAWPVAGQPVETRPGVDAPGTGVNHP